MFGQGQEDRSPTAMSRKIQKGKGSARGCLVVLFALFLTVGCIILYIFTLRPITLAFSAQDWQAVPCTIVSSQVERHEGDDSTTYGVDIVYTYDVGGKKYQGNRYSFVDFSSSGYKGKKAIVDRYPPGSQRLCYVDPSEPSQSVLNRRITPEMFVGLFALIFVLVGGIGLLATCGVFRRRRADPERGEPITEKGRGFPPASRYDDPTRLPPGGPVTLKPSGSPLGNFVGLLLFAMFWNGIVSVFVWQAAKSFRGGDPEWFLAIFLIPFVLVGLVVIFFVFYSFLALFNPRPALTLSSRSVSLGDSIELSWRFSGQTGSIRQLRITLKGEEKAEYRRGTRTYTDTETFAEISVIDTTDFFDIPSGSATVTVPSGTMHSFEASHNKIVWSINVAGEIGWWPDVNESFPLEVLPKIVPGVGQS